MKSLTPVRTARLIASLIAFLGMFAFGVERVLTKVLALANHGVQMGLNRYSNSFTGRFAASNFSDDKNLLILLRQAKDLLPTAELYSAFRLYLLMPRSKRSMRLSTLIL